MIALFSLLVSLWLSPAPFFPPSSSVPPLFVTPPSCLAFVPPSLSLACCVHKSHALSRHTHTHTKSTKNANAHGRSFANTADMHGNECFFTIIQTERKTIKHTHTHLKDHTAVPLPICYPCCLPPAPSSCTHRTDAGHPSEEKRSMHARAGDFAVNTLY